jgi:spermidine synthase
MPFLLGTILFIPNLSPNRINRTLEPQNWTLLDRAWSTTGYISVLENHSAGYRVLRCDHSLLGGEWLLTHHRREKENWIVAEPTYAVFEMLEAVRLVTSPDIPALADKDAKALVIGLGIGTAPKALIAHGIDTTIVEIDSKIHEFATRYFELPGNHTSVTADATEWIARRSGSHSDSDSESTNTNTGKESEKYDYIIHDVFTGGASPLELFTAEFLLNLRGQLKAGSGVIAINYAGDLSLSLTRHVLRTIENVFDGRRNCRVYRDGDAPLPPAGERDVEKKNSENDGKKESQYTTDGTDSKKSNKDDDDNANANAETSHSAAQKTKKNKKTPAAQNQNKKEKYDDIAQADFTNIIIFCRNTIHSSSPSTAEKPKWSFRPPTPSDYLQTHSRRQYLLPKDEYEIAFPPSFTSADPSASDLEDGSILEAGNQDLWAEQQLESARRHWGLMRKVVPGVVWDTW